MAIESEFIMRAVLDMSDPQKQIEQFEAWARQRAKSAPFAGTTDKLTQSQRIGPGGASEILGKEQGVARARYEQGGMGPPGSPTAIRQLRAVYAAQRQAILDQIPQLQDLTKTQKAAFNASVGKVRAATVQAIYDESGSGRTGADKLPPKVRPAPTRAKKLTDQQQEAQDVLETKLGKERAIEGVKRAEANKLGTEAAVREAAEQAKITNTTAREAARAHEAATKNQVRTEKLAAKAQEEVVAAEKHLNEVKKKAPRAKAAATFEAKKVAEAAQADVDAVRAKKKGGVPEAKVAAGQAVDAAAVEAARKIAEQDSIVNQAGIRLVNAQSKAVTSQENAEKALQREQDALERSGRAAGPKKERDDQLTYAKQLDAAAGEEVRVKHQEVKDLKKTAAERRIEQEDAARAKGDVSDEAARQALLEEQITRETAAELKRKNDDEQARQGIGPTAKQQTDFKDKVGERGRTPGEGVWGVGVARPTEIARKELGKRIEAAEAKILENAELLGTDLSDRVGRAEGPHGARDLFADQQRILAEQRRQYLEMRRAADQQALETGLSKKYGADLNFHEALAADAADDRSKNVKTAAATEAALLNQLGVIRRKVNVEESSILTLIGQERALRQARLAIEKSSEVRAISDLNLRPTIVQGKFDSTKEDTLQELMLKEKLAADKGYVEARHTLTALLQKEALLEQNAVAAKLAADSEYVSAQQTSVLRKQQDALVDLEFKRGSKLWQDTEVQTRLETAALQQGLKNAELKGLLVSETATKEKAKGVLLEQAVNRKLAQEVRDRGLVDRPARVQERAEGDKSSVIEELMLRKRQAADQEFIAAKAEITAITKKAALVEANSVQAKLAVDAEYVAALQTAILQKQEATLSDLEFKRTSQLWQDQEVEARIEGAAVSQLIKNAELEFLASSQTATAEKAKGILLEQEINRKLQQEVRAQGAGARPARVNERVAATKDTQAEELLLQKRLAADNEYVQGRASLAAILKKSALVEANLLQAILAADAEYVAAQQAAIVSKQQATLQEIRFKTGSKVWQDQELAIRTEGAAIQQSLKNAELKSVLLSDAATKEKAKGIVLQEQVNRKLAKEVLERGLSDRPARVQERFDVTKSNQLEELMLQKRLAADESYVTSKARQTALTKKAALLESNAVSATLAADAEYIAAQQVAATAKQASTLAELKFKSTNLLALKQETAIKIQTNALQQTAKNLELEALALDQVGLKAKAKGIVLEEQYNRLLAAEVRAQGAAAGLTQRGLIAKLRGANDAGGGGYGGGGKYGIGEGGGTGAFFRGGAASTLRHALPSVALFGAAAGIVSTVKSAEELERQMVLIEGQFTATDKAAEFPRFKQTILDLARGSGLAAEEVANIGFQLQGAFEGIDAQTNKPITLGGFSGQGLVEEQLEASTEIAKVTGLSQEEIVDSLTATSFAFDSTFREIGDVTLSLQGRFGVLAREIIPFLGDIAPVAKDAGFSLEEFSTIVALTQQKSGRSGTALAEAYGRVLPAITDAKLELIDLASTNDSLNNEDFLGAVSRGDVGEIFLQLAESFNGMNDTSQDFVINLLGGRREASAILSAFSDGDTLMKQIRDTEADRGQLAERFNELQDTLAQKVDKLKENVRQLGLAIYEAGLADVLGLLADVISLASSGVVLMMQAFGGLNDAVGGLPAKLLAVLAVIKLIQVASKARAFQGIGGALSGGVSGFADRARGTAGMPIYGPGGGDPVSGPGDLTGATGAERFRGGGFRGGVNAIGGTTAVGLAATALLQLKSAREEQQANVNAAGERVTKALGEASAEEVREFIDSRNTFMDQVRTDGWGATIGAWVNGAKTLQQRGIDASQQESSGRMIAALEETARIAGEQAGGGVPIGPDADDRTIDDHETKLWTQDAVNQLTAEFEANPTDDVLYEQAREVLNEFAAVDDDIKGRINRTLQNHIKLRAIEADRQEAEEEAAQAADDAAQSLEAVKAQYDSGDATIIALEDAYDRSIASLRESLAANGGQDPKIVRALQEVQLAKAQAISAALNDTLDFRQQIEGFTGRGGPSQEIQQLVDLLKDPRFSDPAARRQALLDILTLQQQILESRAEAADDAGEAIKILENGIKIPKNVRVELIRQQLNQNNVRFSEFLETIVAHRKGLSESFRRMITKALALGGRGIRALRRQLRAERERLESYLQGGSATAAEHAAGEIAAYDRTLEELDKKKPFGVETPRKVRGSKESRKQYQEEQVQAAAEYAQSVADAQQEAAEEAREAADELADARADYFLSLVENDPVAAARHGLSEADRMYRKATTEAERVRAQAERIRAQRNLQQAIQEVFASQFDLLTAMFGYSGDAVKVAQVALRQAQQQLRFLSRQGAGDAEINRAKAAIIDAQGGLRDARLNRKLEDYAFLYDMERINKQQYIAYLMQLRETPDLTRDQLRALDRQIKQLRDDLGADFQFNLPTNIALPTLYEVRRAGQTPGGAGAYTDNRVVTVNVNVSSQADLQALERVLASSVGQNVNGTVARRY